MAWWQGGNGGTQGTLLGLSVSDFGVEMLTRDEMRQRQHAVDREIGEMIGYDKAKAFIAELKAKVEYVGGGGDRKKLESCLNCVVTGNPGTGKTTFARLFFKFLRAYGVLQKDVFVEINGLDLKGQYVGSTGPKVQGYFRQAMGGCLFIDEAYAVNDREGGQFEAALTASKEIRATQREAKKARAAQRKHERERWCAQVPRMQRRPVNRMKRTQRHR